MNLALDRWTLNVQDETDAYNRRRHAELRAEGMARKAGWKIFRTETVEETQTRARLVDGEHATLHTPLPDETKGEWHLRRARGYLHRFERVADCQKEVTIEIQCEHCGRATRQGQRCRMGLVCVGCRGKIAHEKRAAFCKNRRAAKHLCAQAGLFYKRRRGGRWSEKLLTCTVPHFPELGVTERIAMLFKAKDYFARDWNRYLKQHEDVGRYKDRQGNLLARWYRSTEWTMGEDWTEERGGSGLETDAKGHAHFHLWYLGPYLPGARKEDDKRINVVRNLWRNALRLAAQDFPELAARITPRRYRKKPKTEPWEWREIDGLDSVIVDVRSCSAGKDAAGEIIKYIVKDVVKDGRTLPASTWAKVYEGFDAKRTTQASRGFMSLADREEVMSGYRDVDADPETGELRPIPLPFDLHIFAELKMGCRCGRCGARGLWKVRRVKMEEEEREWIHARRPLKKGRSPVALEYVDAFDEAGVANG
jgi:hypothetical protein